MSGNICEFSTNWNNKLECKNFTTIRLSHRLVHHSTILVRYQNKYKVCKKIDQKTLKISQFNDWICRLDTGYDVNTTIEILEKMYKFDHTKEDKLFYWFLLESVSGWISIDDVKDFLDI